MHREHIKYLQCIKCKKKLKYKIFQRKTARDMRFYNVRKENEEEYSNLWVEKNK